jgi:hypothetical protein
MRTYLTTLRNRIFTLLYGNTLLPSLPICREEGVGKVGKVEL